MKAATITLLPSPDWEGLGMFHDLAADVLTELHLHEDFAASWKVDLRTHQPQPEQGVIPFLASYCME